MKQNYWKEQVIKFGQVGLLAMVICGGKVALGDDFSSPVVPGDRGGNGRNGHVVDVDMTPILLDLTKKAVCEWKQGEELIEELPSLEQTLSRLEKLDWYFAYDLRREIKSLRFCLTGALHKNPTDGKGSVIEETKAARQAGLRLNENVYLDLEIFYNLNEVNQSMLIVHETMHSYFGSSDSNRSLKLRSMVSALNDVRVGKIKTRMKLHQIMKNNQVEFPLMHGALEDYKSSILFLLATEEEQADMVLESSNPEDLIKLDERVLSQLLARDQKALSLPQRWAILESALYNALSKGSDADFVRLLNEIKFKVINPAQMMMGDFSRLSIKRKNIVLNSRSFGEIIKNGLERILAAHLVYQNHLLYAPYDLQALGLQWPEKELVPLYEIELPSKLSNSLRWLPEMMIFLQSQGQLSVIVKNENFYSALGLKNQKIQVMAQEFSISRERRVALERLDQMSKKIISLLLNELNKKLDLENYQQIVNQIEFNKFE